MSSTPKILMVSNLQTTSPLWALSVTQQHWEVTLEAQPTRAVQRWAETLPDLIVCDVDSDPLSIAVITTLRDQVMLPILLLSSNRSDQFILDAYAAGVDEYVIKPLHPLIFEAKLKVWLRRSSTVPVDVMDSLKVDDIELIPSDGVVVLDAKEPIHLTHLELRLLYSLMGRPGRTLGIKELCQRVWSRRSQGDATTLKNLVYRLRRKIEPDPAHPQYVHTVFGVGYRFMAL